MAGQTQGPPELTDVKASDVFIAKDLQREGAAGTIKCGYGVLFEFSDGWVEACFHMRKEEAERHTANRRERSFADLCRSIEARDVCPCYEYLEIYPRAALDRDKVNCEPARGLPALVQGCSDL